MPSNDGAAEPGRGPVRLASGPLFGRHAGYDPRMTLGAAEQAEPLESGDEFRVFEREWEWRRAWEDHT